MKKENICEKDREALVSLFSELENGMVDLDSLYGLFIAENGRVVSLHLSEKYSFKTIPGIIKEFTKLRNLFLSNTGIKDVSEWLSELSDLETLDLSKNMISRLPNSVGEFSKLKFLDVSSNALTSLPESIENLTNLEVFNLGDNNLSVLPDSIGRLVELKYLDVSNNSLVSLPDSIGNLENLQTLNLDKNPLEYIQDMIINLPKLKKLGIDDLCPKGKIELLKNKLINISETYDLKLEDQSSLDMEYILVNFRFDYEGMPDDFFPIEEDLFKLGRFNIRLLINSKIHRIDWQEVYFVSSLHKVDISLQLIHKDFGVLWEILFYEHDSQLWEKISGERGYISSGKFDTLGNFIQLYLNEAYQKLNETLELDKFKSIIELEERYDQLKERAVKLFSQER